MSLILVLETVWPLYICASSAREGDCSFGRIPGIQIVLKEQKRGKSEPPYCCPSLGGALSLSSFVLFSSWSSEGSQMWFRVKGERSWGKGSLNVGMGVGGDKRSLCPRVYPISKGHSKSFYLSSGYGKGRASFPGELREAKREGRVTGAVATATSPWKPDT